MANNGFSFPQQSPAPGGAAHGAPPIGVLEEDAPTVTSRLLAERPAAPWKILIVDDEPDVHETTEFVLKSARIMGRSLKLLRAFSAREAFDVLQEHKDIAVAMIDVVMEEEHAGLKLVRRIREAGFSAMRIILRTGQPGQAPELTVIREYDINDYRTKSELTHMRLVTALTTAIRAYRDIKVLEETRRGLELIVHSSKEIYRRQNMKMFGQGVLTQIGALLGGSPNGIACATKVTDKNAAYYNDYILLAASGSFAEYAGLPLSQIPHPRAKEMLAKAEATSAPVAEEDAIALLVENDLNKKLYVYADSIGPLSENDLSLLKVFTFNLSVSFENLLLLEKLNALAFTDQTLDMPNRNAYERELRSLLDAGNQSARIALIHVDDVPSLAATFGSRYIDDAIGAIYSRLASYMGEDCFIAYKGHGHLAVVDPSGQKLTDGTLMMIFSSPFAVSGSELRLSATIAILDIKSAAADVRTISRALNATLIKALQEQKGKILYYSNDMHKEIERRVDVSIKLHKAIADHLISFDLQPKVDIMTGALIGVEALARWKSGNLQVPPSEFIPIAEASSLTRAITWSALDQSAAWLDQRRKAKAQELPVAINLSMIDIQRYGFVEDLLDYLAKRKLTADQIQFEVTESAAMLSPHNGLRALELLHNAGYSIALDDFGTGFSSLSYLQHLPIETLKIDRSFIRSLTVENARTSITASSCAIAQNLGLEIVAEGVENSEQHYALRFLGVQFGQGYHYGRPMPMDQFDEWERNWHGISFS